MSDKYTLKKNQSCSIQTAKGIKIENLSGDTAGRFRHQTETSYDVAGSSIRPGQIIKKNSYPMAGLKRPTHTVTNLGPTSLYVKKQ